MSKPQILDLDKIIEDQRVVRLAGKEIDVSVLPSRVTLELAAIDNTSFPQLLKLIEFILEPLNERAQAKATGKKEESPNQ